MYTLNVTNDGSITHALEAEGPSGETETEDLAPGDSAELKVNFENGSYELYCPIGNHKDLGHDDRRGRQRLTRSRGPTATSDLVSGPVRSRTISASGNRRCSSLAPSSRTSS